MPRRIMVVDDTEVYARAIQSYLLMAGYKVDIETEPGLAIPRIIVGDYDLVVSGTEMPPSELRGYEMMDRVREAGCEVPFMGLSFNPRKEVYWEDRGATFFDRYFSTEEFLDAVREILH
jgi:CheY-like chemotaxis protein